MSLSKAKQMTLASGQCLKLEQEGAVAVVLRGAVDVYAATGDGRERMFLLERGKGQYVFGLYDEFQKLEIFLYAKKPVELAIYNAADAAENCIGDAAGLRDGMRDWFKSLLVLPWLRFFAVRNDDYVGGWNKTDFLLHVKDEQLWLTFLEHENILAMFLSGQFNSLRKYFSQRLEVRRQKKQKLIDASINILTGEEDAFAPIYDDSDGLTQLARRIGVHFQMEIEGMTLPKELKQRQSDFAILNRLLVKGGVRLRRVVLEEEWFSRDSGVLLVQRDKEWLAALPETPEKYYLYAADGSKTELNAELAAELSNAAYACYAGFPQRPLRIKDLLQFMLRQCWRNDYITIVLASFFAGLTPLVTPIISKSIFSDVIPIGDRQGLTTLTQVILVVGFTTAALSLVRSIAVLRISNHLNIATEAALWSRLLAMPADFFKKYETGELLGRMQGINAIKTFVTGDFISSVFNVIFSLWSVFLMCYYSFKLTLTALCLWLVYFIITAFIYRRVINFQRHMINADNKTSAKVVQIFNGLAKFRIQGAEEQAFYLWAKCFGEQWKWNLKLRWQNNFSAIINMGQPLLLSLLLYYIAMHGIESQAGGANFAQAAMSYAEFIAFQAAYSAFNATLLNMVPLAASFFSVQPQIENLRPLLEAVPEQSDEKLEAGRLSGELELRHLSFAYSKDGPEVLRDLNLFINAGEAVAIVGRSGCGKSTLLRLLLGFEKPLRGAVYYDNMDLAELNVASVRSQLGVVLQNGKLMAGTIFENIIGASGGLTIDDAWKASERVGLAQDIREMPMQMHTMISEGSGNISGGQRQRILLARSIVHNPRVLMLDEATSALDNTTQAVVSKSLNEMRCTRLIIAHRLSTIKNVNRILVMDKGRIVEEGSYAELMDRNGSFAELARRQLT